MLRHKSDHPTKNCTLEGCERPLRAKGRCAAHYNQLYRPGRPNRHEYKLFACAFCGKDVMRSTGGGRKYGATCSNECRQWLVRPYCKLPANHWARWYGKTSNWKPPAQKHIPELRECGWCASPYTATQATAKHCSKQCGRKANKARRRALEHGAEGTYTWSQVMAVHMRGGKRCSYCDTPTAQPEPDHVIPISRGGRNGIENILPCCSLCNADKGDMTPTEWDAYRQRQGKPQRRTTFDWKDIRFTHLMLGEAKGTSHRLREEKPVSVPA